MATKGIDKTGNNWIRVIGDTGEMLIYIDGKWTRVLPDRLYRSTQMGAWSGGVGVAAFYLSLCCIVLPSDTARLSYRVHLSCNKMCDYGTPDGNGKQEHNQLTNMPTSRANERAGTWDCISSFIYVASECRWDARFNVIGSALLQSRNACCTRRYICSS